MKKSILFVINTMGGAGAERALLTLLRAIDPQEYEVSLYVLMSQGELIGEVPEYVSIRNEHIEPVSVLAAEGRRYMKHTVINNALNRRSGFKLFGYMISNLMDMLSKKRVQPDKLLWRVLSDGADHFDEEYDLAVAFLEGGSTYYVADHVRAKHKVAFVHVDYTMAGYTRRLDRDAYNEFEKIFCVSDEVKSSFLAVYPEHRYRTEVMYNMIDVDRIRRMAGEGIGFSDGYDGFRILTVGRLNQQKAYETAIDAMHLIKYYGYRARWYVLGEGELREELTGQIHEAGLDEDFILLGAVSNPFPYYRECDLYVHATRYEGKSIAVQEAQVLGKPILVSDVPGNREQIRDGIDGRIVSLDPGLIANAIMGLMDDPTLRESLGREASKIPQGGQESVKKLLAITDDRMSESSF